MSQNGKTPRFARQAIERIKKEEKETLIVGKAITSSAKLRLGADWFDLESLFIKLHGLGKGIESADTRLLELISGFAAGRTAQELTSVLEMPFHLLDLRLVEPLEIISNIQQKCGMEIAAWHDALEWICCKGMDSKEVLSDLYPRLLQVHSRILDYSERPELQLGARRCLASAREHLDYGSLAAKAIQEKRESIEWFYAIILTIFDKMIEEKTNSKICADICCENELGTEPPSWLKELVEMITKSCKKEALAFAALKCAVVSHCTYDRVLEIVQERLGS